MTGVPECRVKTLFGITRSGLVTEAVTVMVFVSSGAQTVFSAIPTKIKTSDRRYSAIETIRRMSFQSG
jgi:hypothetical protein